MKLTRDMILGEHLTCTYCQHYGPEVQLESSRTMYDWDGKGLDPNADVPLCINCAEEHHKYWDERWNDYYQGRY